LFQSFPRKLICPREHAHQPVVAADRFAHADGFERNVQLGSAPTMQATAIKPTPSGTIL
jgi:hypothetical protein